MENIISIFKQINNTSSRNEKELILKQNKNNNLLKEVLNYTYDPYKIYGIGKKAFNSKIGGNSEFNNVIDLLKYLLKNNTGTDFVKAKVNIFINSQPKEHQEWYKKIILKDLGIGITSKTINKVFPDLIPVFDCMLASPYEERKFKDIILEPKLDGIRVVYLNSNLLTRNGKILEGFNEIQEQLKQFPQDYVFDGELMGKDFSSTQELTFKKQNNKIGINYNIFDCIPVGEFQSGKSRMILKDRKNVLNEIFSSYNNIKNLKKVNVIYEGRYDLDEINKAHLQIIQDGFEGSMIKDLNSIYECKRTKTWIKKKDFLMYDLKVVDMFEGNDQFKDMLGGLVVDYKGYNVEVGSGFNFEDRVKFWNSKNLILNKTIMVQAQEETHNKNGETSLRFPVFKGIRLDK